MELVNTHMQYYRIQRTYPVSYSPKRSKQGVPHVTLVRVELPTRESAKSNTRNSTRVWNFAICFSETKEERPIKLEIDYCTLEQRHINLGSKQVGWTTTKLLVDQTQRDIPVIVRPRTVWVLHYHSPGLSIYKGKEGPPEVDFDGSIFLVHPDLSCISIHKYHFYHQPNHTSCSFHQQHNARVSRTDGPTPC